MQAGTASFRQRLGKRLCRRPAHAQSPGQATSRQSCKARPFRKGSGLAVVGEQAVEQAALEKGVRMEVCLPGFPQGKSQGFFQRPAVTKTANQGARGQAFKTRPLRKGEGLPLECKAAIAARIVALISAGCPATIIRGIVAVDIFAIDAVAAFHRMGSRAFAHIMKKVFERCAPMFADSDTPLAVQVIRSMGAVIAPLQHVCPGLVGNRFGLTVCCSHIR